MRFAFKQLFLAAAFAFLAQTGSTLAQEKISINFDESNHPFMYGAASEAKGIYPSLIEAVFNKMGTPAHLEAMPWKRAIANIDEGKAGVGGLYKNTAREAKYDYSAPLYEEKLVLYTLKGKSFPYAKLEDLNGKALGAVRGWSYGDAFDAARTAGKFKVEEAESDQLNLKKLVADRVDAIIASPLAIEPILKKEALAGKIEALPNPLAANDTYLAFNKKAGQSALLVKFNEALAAMKADGSYEKLTKTE